MRFIESLKYLTTMQKIGYSLAIAVITAAMVLLYIYEPIGINGDIILLTIVTLWGLPLDIFIVQRVVESVLFKEWLEYRFAPSNPIRRVLTCAKCFGFWSGLTGSIALSIIIRVPWYWAIIYIALMSWTCSFVNYAWYLTMQIARYPEERRPSSNLSPHDLRKIARDELGDKTANTGCCGNKETKSKE